MPHSDHYAILLGINFYPGLSDLAGPENDIDEFRKWLVHPDGGDVPATNVQVIKSSDFQKTQDPNDANPTERALNKALNRLVRDSAGDWKERVGARLYLYMAGHGFTAGSSITDPALFSAVAQNGDPAHIAGYRYASKIANAGFFDEIVLIMDCCQDVLKATQVLEPTWSPIDRNQTSRVKLLQAYGAPRGKAAYERELSDDGMMRGIFSKVLLEALATALPDDAGFVTGATLKNQFLQLWGDRYKAETHYDPPIRLPDGEDIRLFARSAAASAVKSVRFELQPPIPAGAQLQITSGTSHATVLSIPAADVAPQSLAPGLYKAILTGTERSCLFEVTGDQQERVTL